MRDISEYFVVQQDSVPVKETVDLSTETTANSLHLNPVDYKVWSLLREQVYKVKVNNFYELCQRIQTVWYELDQCIIDKAIKQWHTRLRACIETKGGHFEHKL